MPGQKGKTSLHPIDPTEGKQDITAHPTRVPAQPKQLDKQGALRVGVIGTNKCSVLEAVMCRDNTVISKVMTFRETSHSLN